tara:strand:+ start:237 stop:863 length:627 start_codon:yes stop_codon:yes gene_type:complete
MNLIKFLLVDAGLIIVGIPFLLIFQGRKKKNFLLKTLNQKELLGNAFKSIPNQKQLLELEKLARKEGSGIQFNSLIGVWEFVSVWKQGSDQEDSILSSLLRVFSASLELKKNEINKDENQFTITNSIRFGLLSILFTGEANLKGKQPILPFFFNQIELKAGENILFNRSLQIPQENQKPFFALIATGENNEWLSARGRGGGLAFWVKS